MTIFNRKELTITFDAAQRVKIQQTLNENHIAFTVKCVGRNNPSVFGADMHAGLGNIGEKADYANEYVFYVHRNDYEKARKLLRL